MGFLAPLGLLALFSLPALTTFYFLKVKRERRVVSSTILFEAAVLDVQGTRPWQRWRFRLLWLLQILAALLLSLSLARPYFLGAKTLVGRRLLVVDLSASMAAPGVMAESRRRLMDLAKGGETMIIGAGASPRILLPYSSDRDRISRSIAALAPDEAPSSLDRAVAMAIALTRDGPGVPIVVVTDGQSPVKQGVRVVSVGHPRSNVAITAFGSLDRDDVGPEIFVGVTNYSETPEALTLQLRVEDRLADARRMSLPAGGTRGVVFQPSRGEGKRVVVSFDHEDGLAIDNRAYGILPSRAALRVAVVSPEASINRWLARALTAGGNARLTALASPPQSERFDLVIYDGVTPDRVGSGAYLFLNPERPIDCGGQLLPGPPMDQPALLAWNRRAPLMKDVALTDVHMVSARPLELPPLCEVLAETGGGPIIAGRERGAIRFEALGFDYRSSDFPYRVAFPIWLQNALAILPARSESTRTFTYPAGTAVRPPSGGKVLRVTDPEGKPIPVGDLIPAVAKTGFYRVTKSEGPDGLLAVTLLARSESNLLAIEDRSKAKERPGIRVSRATSRREIHLLLLAAVLGLMLLEWTAFHRGLHR